MSETRDGFVMQPIGYLRTPYEEDAPYQPVDGDEGEFSVVLDPMYADGLYRLDRFEYAFVVYLVDRVTREVSTRVKPPWAGGYEVGLFASRSPVRPNPIGLSVVRILGIEGNVIRVSGLDAFDGTPVLDVKPYIAKLDSKDDANLGWVDDLPDKDHLTLHILGIPHDY